MKVSKYLEILSGSLLPAPVHASYEEAFDHLAEQLAGTLDAAIGKIAQIKVDPKLTGQGKLEARNRVGRAAVVTIDSTGSRLMPRLQSDLKRAQADVPMTMPGWQQVARADAIGLVASLRQQEIRAMYAPNQHNNLLVRDALLTAAGKGDGEVVSAFVNAPSVMKSAWRLTDDDINAAVAAYNLATKPEQSAALETVESAIVIFTSNLAVAKKLIADACQCSVAALMELPAEGKIPMSAPQPAEPVLART